MKFHVNLSSVNRFRDQHTNERKVTSKKVCVLETVCIHNMVYT